MRSGNRQKNGDHRNHDSVVESAFHVERLPNANRQPRIAHYRLAERSIRRGKNRGDERGLDKTELAKESCRRHRSECNRQRKADPEQAQREKNLLTKRTDVDAYGIREENQHKSGLNENRHGFALKVELKPLRPCRKHHRGRDWGESELARDHREGKNDYGDDHELRHDSSTAG